MELIHIDTNQVNGDVTVQHIFLVTICVFVFFKYFFFFYNIYLKNPDKKCYYYLRYMVEANRAVPSRSPLALAT
jgi:hypothetical protein